MNPLFAAFLFAMSLLAIAASVALLLYIYNELKAGRQVEQTEENLADEENYPGEQKQVSRLLSKMKAASAPGKSRPRKMKDTDSELN